jgi:hypothetical protein
MKPWNYAFGSSFTLWQKHFKLRLASFADMETYNNLTFIFLDG